MDGWMEMNGWIGNERRRRIWNQKKTNIDDEHDTHTHTGQQNKKKGFEGC